MQFHKKHPAERREGEAPALSPDEASMLIDRFMSEFDQAISHHLIVNAPADATYEALTHLDFARIPSPLLKAVMKLRLARLKRARRRHGDEDITLPKKLTLETMSRIGRVKLAEEPGHEIVIGAIERRGQPHPVSPEEFAYFERPGHLKGAAEFSVRSFGKGRSLVSYEARVRGTDARSCRRLKRAMRLFSPLGKRLMRNVLREVKKQAERQAGEPAATQ